MKIKAAQSYDLLGIQNTCLNAFPDEENHEIIKLAGELLAEETEPPILSFIAEIEGEIAGYIGFSPVYMDGGDISGYILAPLAILPKYQKMGIGSKLIEFGKNVLADQQIDVLLVYGDPNYYGRFGFNAELGRLFTPPYPLEYPTGWHGLYLNGDKDIKEPIGFECVAALSKPDLW